MCSIIGSFNRQTAIELYHLNAPRGSFSYSIAYFDPKTKKFQIVHQGFENIDIEKTLKSDIFNNKYIIMHRQAPTGGLIQDSDRIHPAKVQDNLTDIHYLYHNGIVKTNDLKRLQKILNKDFEWDTLAILTDIVKHGLSDALKFLDASFACLYVRSSGNPLIFRNSSSVLYVDDELNISSTEFEFGSLLPVNKVYKLNFNRLSLDEVMSFDNIEDRYFFA